MSQVPTSPQKGHLKPSQERDVILRRILYSLRILLHARSGISIKDLRDRLAEIEPELRFTEQTIRRDCRVFEELGLIKTEKARVMVVHSTFSDWFRIN
jgi:Fe2+ or Zn2+ uptake regulation protein